MDLEFVSLQEFRLKWRFSGPKYNKLPSEVLSKIRPLCERSSSQIAEVAKRLQVKIKTLGMCDNIRVNSDHDRTEIKAWLLERLPITKDEVFVSWDLKTGIITNWGLFCDYWDDFWYPGDDLVIWSSDEDWTIYFSHEEVVFFAGK